jgi:hypothetical protein
MGKKIIANQHNAAMHSFVAGVQRSLDNINAKCETGASSARIR